MGLGYGEIVYKNVPLDFFSTLPTKLTLLFDVIETVLNDALDFPYLEGISLL